MKIRKGDTVKIIAGKDKGKTGEVIAALPLVNRVVVDGVNILVRHKKAQGKDKPSGRIKVASPIHVSNVMLVDSAGKVSRKRKATAKKVEKKDVKEVKK